MAGRSVAGVEWLRIMAYVSAIASFCASWPARRRMSGYDGSNYWPAPTAQAYDPAAYNTGAPLNYQYQYPPVHQPSPYGYTPAAQPTYNYQPSYASGSGALPVPPAHAPYTSYYTSSYMPPAGKDRPHFLTIDAVAHSSPHSNPYILCHVLHLAHFHPSPFGALDAPRHRAASSRTHGP